MLSGVIDDLRAGPAAPTSMNLVSELLRVVPRFVDRTRSQAELVASLAGHLPCLGGVLGAGQHQADTEGATQPGATEEGGSIVVVQESLTESVPVDVLSVLEADTDGSEPAEAGKDADGAARTGGGAATAAPAPPTEAELPIESYDSLAASQVVPRLATLDEAELLAVRHYESAHRNRQTILNRIAQRLEG